MFYLCPLILTSLAAFVLGNYTQINRPYYGAFIGLVKPDSAKSNQMCIHQLTQIFTLQILKAKQP